MEWEKRRKNQFSSFGWSSSSFYLLLKFWCGFLLMYHESAILKYLVYNIHAIDTEKHNLNNIKLLNGTDAKNIYSNSMIISCLFSSNICITNITLFIMPKCLSSCLKYMKKCLRVVSFFKPIVHSYVLRLGGDAICQQNAMSWLEISINQSL